MKNYKKPGWIEELKDPWEEKSEGLSLPSLKEDKMMDHSLKEQSKNPVLKKEKS